MNEILKRMKEISAELDKEGADVEALSKEFSELEERKAQLEKKEHIRKVAGDAVEYDSFEKTNKDERVFDASSVEYRNAYLKNLAVDKNGNKMFGELTESEKRAFTFTTANTSEVVPTIILDRIKELVATTAPLYNDATKGGMAQAFDVVRHTAIEAGDADATAEGVANDDEEDNFDVIPLVGVEIKKHAVVTRKMRFQSISAFEDWLVQHAKDKIILTRLNSVTTGIAAGNVITGTYADATIRGAFALIKSNGLKFVYANNKTIYNGLAGIEDGSGRKAFIPSAMEDAITQGRLYGAGVKLDENIADDVAYIGVPADILANDFDNYEFMRDIDAKTWQEVFSGYSLFDAALENPYAFVKVTFTSETSEGDGE